MPFINGMHILLPIKKETTFAGIDLRVGKRKLKHHFNKIAKDSRKKGYKIPKLRSSNLEFQLKRLLMNNLVRSQVDVGLYQDLEVA